MRTECPKCGGGNLNNRGDCRPCRAEYMREWSAENSDRLRRRAAELRKDPARRQKKREADKAYRDANRESLKTRRAEYHAARNADEAIKARKRAWYEANKAKLAAAAKERYATKKETPEFKAQRAKAAAERRANSPMLRVHERMSAHVRQCLKGEKDGRPWEKLVGYTLADLVVRLRQTLRPGWRWQDFLDASLEIDHIVPVSAFRFESAEDPDFRRCWALGNLQLLTWEENNEKRGKVPAWFRADST